MNLFELEDGESGGKMGFRLKRLEVYNWGTFHEKIWTLDLNGDTSLLTGDVGSGKSTLVDALITLLVPPKKITYNKAADASAKERSLHSYVRGFFGQKRTEEGSGQPEALRGTDGYSVILANFADDNGAETATLAQVFWYGEELRRPVRFYVFADKNLFIQDHFSNFGSDMRMLKKTLNNDKAIHIHEDYPPYARDFRRKFGIKQEQALDLFQQTISMKKVDELTGFVRQNMLELPDTAHDVEQLLAHFYDLDAAHHAVLKAKKQQSILRPIAQIGDGYRELSERNVKFGLMQMALKAWFAEQANGFLHEEVSLYTENYTREQKQARQYEENLQEVEGQLTRVAQDIARNGGQRLEILRQEIQNDQVNLKQRGDSLNRYMAQAELLALPLPDSNEIFANNKNLLDEKKLAEEKEQEELAGELSDGEINCNEVSKEQQKVKAELESLRLRKSSIPKEYVEIRDCICRDLDLADSEIPFAGELIEVKAEDSAWEGAIERLLRGFGISMLVPDSHYAEVVEWIERTNLKLRLVYYRVKDFAESTTPSRGENTVFDKVNIREDSPFCHWLENELCTRYRHVCCENMQEFRRENYAVTMSGQVKVNGKRHEKDDRHRLDDRRQYILGFSNQKKIEALEEELKNITAEIRHWQKLIKEVKARQKNNQQRIAGIEAIASYADFSAIDVKTLETLIAAKKAELLLLEKENDILKILQEKQTKLSLAKGEIKEQLEVACRSVHQLEMLIRQAREKIKENDELIATLDETTKQNSYPRLDENKAIALQDQSISLKKIVEQENQYYHWLAKRAEENRLKLAAANDQLIRKMMEYNTAYPQETNMLDASPISLHEYKALLQKLELDGLPKFEEKFKTLLKENTINQIALFHHKLQTACEEIKERIDMINQSLNTIDYNEGRYIQLEYYATYDSEIKDFRMQLRDCTDGVLSGTEDEQYAEIKFLQVKEIVERFRGRPGYTDLDAKWKNKVIDVRNWYAFAAAERWRENDEEYEHYTDSGGKSGGQKEKLAYTILAASLVYNFGLEAVDKKLRSFRFVVIDEAFLKSSDDSARFGLELFRKLDLQLLVVTPLLKIATIEPFVTHVGFVYQDDENHISSLRNLTIKELQTERKAYNDGTN